MTRRRIAWQQVVMPLVETGNSACYYRDDGADRPALMLSHSLGLDHGMWDPQIADWLPHFRILRYDTRGHGASSATAGDYAIAISARECSHSPTLRRRRGSRSAACRSAA